MSEAQSLSPCTYCLSPPSGLGGNTGLNKRNAEGPEQRLGFNHPPVSQPRCGQQWTRSGQTRPICEVLTAHKGPEPGPEPVPWSLDELFFPKNVKGGTQCCAPEPRPVHLGSIYPPRGWKKKALRDITARTPSFELGEEDQRPWEAGSQFLQTGEQ